MKKTVFDWSNPSVITRNALKPRSYFISYASFNDARKEINPMMFSLNGTYEFCYFSSFLDIPNNFRDIHFQDKINVPSCWQYQGHEKPFYVNNDYVFPFNPPEIPMCNPVGVYRKIFNFKKEQLKKYVLTFLGSSAATVFVNNIEIGYFQGTHNMHEFDITEQLCDGDNEVLFVVYKWNDGSYLETQDMYRDNGIFRDVFIHIYPESYLFDFSITNIKQEHGKYNTKIILEFSDKNLSADFILEDEGKQIIIINNVSTDINFELLPEEWTAETPKLYIGYLSIKKNNAVVEVVRFNVGYKTISMSEGIFKINNRPVKLKGINYHESSFDQGFCVGKELFDKDIEIIKSLNINTIRFAHYPIHPYMLSLCEKHGLYVINEADIETYGCLNTSDKDFVSKSPLFTNQFIDRVSHLYERDKNSPAIIMWSIGNESGVGENLDAAYRFLKDKDPHTPIQYETCFRGEYDDYFKDKKTRGYDIISVMYPSLELIEILKRSDDNRPFYMCEYAHAMGLGPGGTQDYWDQIYACDRFIGGCVWEYSDHANILNPDEKDHEKIKYLYGGDNGEFIHDSNYCIDGIVLPDRRLSSSAHEIQNIYRPFIFRLEGNELFIRNTNSFISSLNYLFKVSLYRDGELVSDETCYVVIEPLQEKKFREITLLDDSEYSLIIETLSDNKVKGIDNFVFGKYKPLQGTTAALVNEDSITGDRYRCLFDRKNRNITSLSVNNEEILSNHPLNSGYSDFDKNKKGFLPIIFRAPTDNDLPLREEWLKKLYHKPWVSFDLLEDKETLFRQKGIFSPGKYEVMFDIESSYQFYREGVLITFSLEAKRNLLPIGRFGIRFDIKKCFNNISWYGRGFRENYPDFRSGCPLKRYEAHADDLSEYYIKPQENGSRGDIRYVQFLNDLGHGFQIHCVDKYLAFSIHDYTVEDATTTRHDFELPKRDFYEVIIDGYVRGLGSQSCGLPPKDEFELKLMKGDKISFSFFLKPISK